MNVAIWLMAGAAAAWFGYSRLKFNAKLGFSMSIVIGAAGGVLGGAWLAPVLRSVTIQPDHFDPLAFVAAAATGMACAIVSDMLRKRFGT